MKPPITYAEFYLRCGYSVIPIAADGSKRPTIKWEEYQHRLPTVSELSQWFSKDTVGIALTHGAVSGNSEMLECESEPIFQAWWDAMIDNGGKEVIDKLTLVVSSPGGGIHLYYRCPDMEIPGNKCIARGLSPVGDHKGVTKIETRGTGGYALAPGTPGHCHPSGRPYLILSGSFKDTPVITPAERDLIFSCAKMLNEVPEKVYVPKPMPVTQEGVSLDYDRPGDEYNARTGAAEVVATMQRHGWTITGQRGNIIDLARPGKSRGTSATIGALGDSHNTLYVFSSSAPPFENEKSYQPFDVLALLEYHGDFVATSRHLRSQGFGKTSVNKPREAQSYPQPPTAPRIEAQEAMEPMRGASRHTEGAKDITTGAWQDNAPVIPMLKVETLAELQAQSPPYTDWPKASQADIAALSDRIRRLKALLRVGNAPNLPTIALRPTGLSEGFIEVVQLSGVLDAIGYAVGMMNTKDRSQALHDMEIIDWIYAAWVDGKPIYDVTQDKELMKLASEVNALMSEDIKRSGIPLEVYRENGLRYMRGQIQ